MPPPPWATCRDLMAFQLIALDKHPRLKSVGIGETLHCFVAKLVMRVAEDQAKMACGRLQLCAGLKADIEGVNHDSLASGDRDDEESEEGSAADETQNGRVETVAVVGGRCHRRQKKGT